MKRCVLIFIAIILSTNIFAQQYQINAHVTGFKNGTKIYLNDTELDVNIDSAIIKDDRFVMTGHFDSPKCLWLTANQDKNFYYSTLLLGNDHLIITGDIKDFPHDLSFKGSKIMDGHKELMDLIKDNFKHRNKLVEEYQLVLRGNPDSVSKKSREIWATINRLDKVREEVTKQYVISHLNTYEGVVSLFNLKDKISRDSMQLLYNKINPRFKKTEFAQRVATYLKVGKILEEGDMATDFTAVDVNNKKHSLSDHKGRYVLLDFSSTYCGPCIESLDELKRVADKFKNELSVITIAGDAGKATWLLGYNRDRPTWLSLWDGKGAHSEISIKYGVYGLPTFVLIDPEGKIVSKWTGYGKPDKGPGAIETKIAKLLAKK